MPYEVLLDGATVPKSVGPLTDANGVQVGHQHQSKVYMKGDILADDDVSPVVVELLENKDPHTSTVLKKVSSKPTVTGPGTPLPSNLSATMGPESGSPGVLKPDGVVEATPEEGAVAVQEAGESEPAENEPLPRNHAELDALAAERGVKWSDDSLSVSQKQKELKAAG